MARTVRDSKLEARAKRLELKARGKPHYRMIDPGFHLGYRRLSGGAGKWVVRLHVEDQRSIRGKKQPYVVETIATADDFSDSNNADVLSFAQAQEKARKWRDKRSRAAAGISGPYTVNKALDDYLEFLRSDGRDDSAIKDAGYRIDAFIRPTLGKFDVAVLEAKQLRRWRAEIAKAAARLRSNPKETQQRRKTTDERARKATANRILTTLKAALNHAFDEEQVSSNKAWGRRVKPFEDVQQARVRYLQTDEATRLINGCDAGFRPMVQAALQTGARYSELARLKAADFDGDAGTVFVQLSKGGKARHVVLSDEGTRFFKQACAGLSGDRLIFRNVARVRRAFDRERKRLEREGNPTGKPVIAYDAGEWRKSEQSRPMTEACKRAGIKPKIGFHGLRHTYASLLVKSGAPLHAVALNLGHVTKDGQPDVRMVTRHYAHFEKSDVAKTIRKHAPTFGFKPTNVTAIG
jgi:integrase